RPYVQAGRVSLREIAARLVEEGAADLVGFDHACELLSEISLDLEMNRFFLTPRRATNLLKDALFTLDSGWSERGLPRYDTLPPAGVPADQYFRSAEAMELIGSTVRMRPETPNADLLRVGLVRSMRQIYTGQWIIALLWDHLGGAVYFDRRDCEMLIVVDEPFSSHSALCEQAGEHGKGRNK
ncbi:MAG: hypothetical protein IMZ46_17830, partial [Acidobacteria bacterium]|nr:hypothetical protein [Acidobacteriota bacterium]